MIDLRDLSASRRVMRFEMFLGRRLPTRIGFRLSWLVAGLIAHFKPTVYRIVRDNLHQVLGPEVEPRTLEETARGVFYTMFRSYFDLFRLTQRPLPEVVATVDFAPEDQEIARSLWNRKGGSILVFPHLGNFDLGGQVIAAHLPEVQVITLPDPPPAFELTNSLRRATGIKVTPLSTAALREAFRSLRRGGVVSIAGDRPVSELDEPFSFFGRPARVPSAHVRLALKTGAVIVTTFCVYSPETGRYRLRLKPPLEMVRTGDRREEVRLNMRRVLDELEQVIRRWPDQWQMLVPVWKI